jgi:serine protease
MAGCAYYSLMTNMTHYLHWRCLGLCVITSLWFQYSLAATALEERNPARSMRRDPDSDTARVIVKFREGATLLGDHSLSATAPADQATKAVVARANALGVRLGTELRAGRALGTRTQVVHARGLSSAALAQHLSAQADVEYAVPDQRRSHFAMPNDPLLLQGPPIIGSTGGPAVGQWYLRSPGGEIASSINATDAWAQTTARAGTIVAVLDTGVRPEHPDLIHALLPGYDMVSDTTMANDGDGRDADASDPGDWVTEAQSSSRSNPFFQCEVGDSSWHGTMTASLIGAAGNNGTGMAGVAFGVQLLPVRVLGTCGGYDSDIIAGMQWAAGLSVPGVPNNTTPARVINLSLGSAGACSQSYLDAINAIVAKPNPAVIVAAAGNSTGHAVSTPANCPGVIAVAGLRHVGTKVGFSDMGPEITISAPGGNCVNTEAGAPCLYPILAATNTGLTHPLNSTYSDAFNPSVGTSFSAPLVAGTVALMLSVRPSMTPLEITRVLQKSARAFPEAPVAALVPQCLAPSATDQLECYCTTATCGAGLLDAARAVSATLAGAPPVLLNFSTGWNLSGSANAASIDVVATFNDSATVESVWKWNASRGRWAFHTPLLHGQALSAYASSKGYEVLTTLSSNDGFWLMARKPFSTALPAGPLLDVNSLSKTLQPGWNLVSMGQSMTPQQFNDSLSVALATVDSYPNAVASIWAWDSAQSKWYFYAPSLATQGGTVLSDFISHSNYEDFVSRGKTLGEGTGFWINRP